MSVNKPQIKVQVQLGGDYPAIVFADSPLGYWRLDESIGSTTVADSSGHSLTGAVTSVVLGQPGLVLTNTAGLFDGQSSKVTVASADPLTGLTACTIQGWENHNGINWTPGSEIVFSQGSTHQHYLAVEHGTLMGSLTISGVRYSAVGAIMPKLGWHYLAMTWASGDYIRLYLDGAPVGLSTTVLSGALSAAPEIHLGWWP